MIVKIQNHKSMISSVFNNISNKCTDSNVMCLVHRKILDFNCFMTLINKSQYKLTKFGINIVDITNNNLYAEMQRKLH